MTTFMIAWHRTMLTPATTSTERRAHFLREVLSRLHPHTHMHLGSSLSLSCHLHGHPRACGLFTLILPFYFLLYLPPLFPLPQLPEVCGKPAQLLQREYGLH